MCYRLACAHAEMNPRKRNTMEDCHRIIPNFNDDSNMAYFGVYDGHGGRNIVDFLEERLEQNILTELRMSDDASVQERLARAYLITDMQSRKCNITTSGILLRILANCSMSAVQVQQLFRYYSNEILQEMAYSMQLMWVILERCFAVRLTGRIITM